MNYERIYEYRFSSVNQDAKNKVWLEISKYIYPLMGNPERILEPGGGRCEFIRSITSAKERWVVDKMSLGPEALSDIRFIQGDIFSIDLPSFYFDGIFISNFLEHLDNHEDIFLLLVKLRKSLRDAGKIAILGPNFKYSFRDYFDCSDHKLALTHLSVEELLYSSGFKIERTIPRFIPYSFRGLFPANRILTRIYLHIPFLWPIFGKQFLILAQKST